MHTRVSEAIWIESKGYWQVKVQKDNVRKAFTSSVKGRKGKHIAEAKADEWLEIGTDAMKVEKAWEEFLEFKRQTTLKAYRQYLSFYKNAIAPELAGKKLNTITPTMWQKCITAYAAKGNSKNTVMQLRALIVSFYRFARRSRWSIQTLEDGDLTIPKTVKPPAQKRSLSNEEIRELFANTPTITYYRKEIVPIYAYVFRFAVATGMRRGEIAGLKHSDIKDGIVTISRSVDPYGQITEGKNDNARRTFELSHVALSVLESQKKMLAERGIYSVWVFPDEYGEHADTENILKQWKRYCDMRGFQMTFHELRHTFISINKSDMPAQLMKHVVGHSARMDTFGVYGHQLEGDRHRAATITDTVLSKIIDIDKVGG